MTAPACESLSMFSRWIAEKGISRGAQDEFAAQSYARQLTLLPEG